MLGPKVPYPGLRPFRRHEAEIFFGRDTQVDELLSKLQNHRFLGVVGPSGCGKSSLIRAGMIPALETGFMSQAGSRWRVAELRPGSHPRLRLARSLIEDARLGDDRDDDRDVVRRFVETTLHRGPLGLIEALRDMPLPEATNLLVLVDQFEEIFRFHAGGRTEEAEAFVTMLLETARRREFPVYIVITMRSDYLDKCSAFSGLPEALNAGQYLTPQLSRREKEISILGPARVFDGNVEADLVTRILNDMGPEPDQLPLMQHLMLRMWLRHANPRIETDPLVIEAEPGVVDEGPTLTLDDYEAVGGFKAALSEHADEAFGRLTPEQQRIAEVLFRSLSGGSADTKDTRRPVAVEEVARVAGVTPDAVIRVVDDFRSLESSFLTPALPEPLFPNTVLDISHESLIRQWERLEKWVEVEARSASRFLRLEQWAQRWSQGKAALWTPPDLDLALEWQEEERPNQAWADRYGGDLSLAERFLVESEKAELERERQEEDRIRKDADNRALRKQRTLLGALSVATLLMGALALWLALDAWTERRVADARTMAAFAGREVASDPERAALLALHSLYETRRHDEQAAALEAEVALRRAMDALALEAVLKVSDSAVAYARFDSAGGRLTAVTRVGEVSRWDVEMKEPLGSHQVLGSVLAMGPHGDLILTYGYDQSIRVWDLDDLTRSDPLPFDPAEVSQILFDPLGNTLVILQTDGGLVWWDWRTAQTLRDARVELPSGTPIAAFGPNGRTLAVTSGDGSALVFREGATDTIRLSDSSVWALAVDPSLDALAVAGGDGNRIRIYSLGEGSEIREFVGHGDRVEQLRFSPDGTMLASAGWDGSVRLWNLRSDALHRVLQGHIAAVTDVNFASDSRKLVTSDETGSVRVWDLQRFSLLPQLPGGMGGGFGAARDVAVSDDGGRAFAAYAAGRVAVWSVAAAALVDTLVGGGSDLLALTADSSGRRVVAGDTRGRITIWKVAQGESPFVIPDAHEDWVRDLAFSPDGQRFASVSDDSALKIWDAETAVLMDSVIVGEDWVYGVAWSRDGRFIATSARDGEVAVFDAVNLRETFRIAPDEPLWAASAVALTSDGGLLAAGFTDGTIEIWDLDREERRRSFSGHRGAVNSIEFGPQGARLLSAGADGVATLWDVRSGAELMEVPAYGPSLNAAALAPGGEILLTADEWGGVRAHPVTRGALMTAARHAVSRSLRVEECREYLDVDEDCPMSVEIRLAEGRSMVLAGDLQGAREMFRSARDMDDRFEHTPEEEVESLISRRHFRRGVELAREGDVDGAVSEFREAGRNEGSGKPFGTVDEVERLAALSYLGRALELARERDIDGARDAVASAAGWEPAITGLGTEDVFRYEATWATILRAAEFAREGRVQETYEGLVFVKGLYPELPIEQYDPVALTLGETVDPVKERAMDLVHEGDLAGAEEVLQRILTFATEHDRLHALDFDDARLLVRTYRVEELLARGRTLAGDHDVEGAAAAFDSILALDPTALAVAVDSIVPARAGSLEVSAASFARVLAAAALLDEGRRLGDRGNRSEALARFQEAAELDPGLGIDPGQEAMVVSYKALVARGRNLARSGAVDEAATMLDEVGAFLDDAGGTLELQPVSYRSGTAEAHRVRAEQLVEDMVLGSIQEGRLGDALAEIDDALTHLGIARAADESIEFDSNSTSNSLCWFGGLLGRAAEVMEHCESAVRRAESGSGDEGAFRDSWGVALAMTGEFEAAAREFRSFVDNPNSGSPEEKAARRTWITDLNAGTNPLADPEVRRREILYSVSIGWHERAVMPDTPGLGR